MGGDGYKKLDCDAVGNCEGGMKPDGAAAGGVGAGKSDRSAVEAVDTGKLGRSAGNCVDTGGSDGSAVEAERAKKAAEFAKFVGQIEARGESPKVKETVEIHGISPVFHLPSGHGRVELITRTRSGSLVFSTVSNVGGFLRVTNEAGTVFVTMRKCMMKIGRNHQPGFFKGYVRGFVSRDHCEIIALHKDLDNSIDFVVRDCGSAKHNGTYYKYHES